MFKELRRIVCKKKWLHRSFGIQHRNPVNFANSQLAKKVHLNISALKICSLTNFIALVLFLETILFQDQFLWLARSRYRAIQRALAIVVYCNQCGSGPGCSKHD